MIYAYKCQTCKNEFDIEHGMNEDIKVVCPKCGYDANKVFGVPSIRFKGSGFYKTDYAEK